MPGPPGFLDPIRDLLTGGASSVSPEVLTVAGLITVGILAALVWAYIRFRRPPAKRFVRTISAHDDVDILLHPNPDPDAMAAGFAAATIAEAAGVSTRIVYPGQLRHDENRAFRTVLGLELHRLERLDDFGDYPVILVDHGVPRGFHGADRIEPIAIVDHHDGEPLDAPHVDVRPEYGACSTIFHEYLTDLGASVDNPGHGLVLTPELATALVYGIHTDTNSLTRGVTKREFDAAQALYREIDYSALDRVSNPPMEAAVLDSKATAIQNRVVRDCYCFSDVGTVNSADTVSTIVEELITLEGITTAVTIGDYDGTLYLSGRSVDDRVHMGEALERALDVLPNASVGGHARMGGAQVAMDALDGIGPNTGLTRDELPDRLFDTLKESD